MNNLYFLYNYNNYFNRKLKRLDTLAEYLTAVGADGYLEIDNVVNFTPNDGVETSQVCNFSSYPVSSASPDYMILCDENNTVLQRWYVIDGKRTRAGQYVFNLYRDVIADSFDAIKTAPVFIEKAILPQNDPFIFNRENMTFNQVKTRETLLKDIIGIPWIIGYMTQDAVTTQEQSFAPSIQADYALNDLNDYTYYSYSQFGANEAKTRFSGNNYKVNCWAPDGDPLTSKTFTFNEYFVNTAAYSGVTPGLIIGDPNKINTFGGSLKSRTLGITAGIKTDEGITGEALLKEDGKIIYINGANKYFRVSLQPETSETITDKTVSTSSAAYTAFSAAVVSANNIAHYLTSASQVEATAYAFKYSGTVYKRKIYIQEIANTNTVSYKISNTRQRLSDQPYSMFCMPYGRATFDGFSGTDYRDWSNISMQTAKDISSKYGGASAALYDLQLLPYCPIREFINGNDNIDLSDMTEDLDFSYITQNNANIGVIFWATKSKTSFDVNFSVNVSDYKIENETKKYRICSPNFAGAFDFSAAMNGGVSAVNVDFTYKPYNPYIHVSPVFGRLYGTDFDDARGLICGGKFDLPQTSDAWASYERSNSNYNSIFDRQIENLEIHQKYERLADVMGAISGTVSGITSGASAGEGRGGAAGAAVGAAIGGTVSAIAGIMDINVGDKLRAEQKDYTKDMYNFNLGNIRALPESLTSVGSLTNNNKLFPFIEMYEATETEIEAFKNKIRYNGMTVGRVGTIDEFSGYTWAYSNGWNYFKGQLIRADIPGEDWHFVNTIKNELNYGIFIKEA